MKCTDAIQTLLFLRSIS